MYKSIYIRDVFSGSFLAESPVGILLLEPRLQRLATIHAMEGVRSLRLACAWPPPHRRALGGHDGGGERDRKHRENEEKTKRKDRVIIAHERDFI